MYGLLYKELIINKKQLISSLLVILLFSAVLFTPIYNEDINSVGEIFLIVSLMMIVFIFLNVGMLQQGLFENDESRKWQYFITSTPNGIQNQIGSKYVFSFLLSMITAAYCSLIHTASCAVLGSDYSLPGAIIYLILPIQIFFRSVEFPFLVRYGSKYGNFFRAAVIFTITFAIIVYLLFGDLSVFGSYESFTNFIINHLFSEDGFSAGFTYILRLIPTASVIIYYISYKISCKLYLKGGEHYDR